MSDNAVVCYKDLSGEEHKRLVGFPLEGCHCPTCDALRAKGQPDMPRSWLEDPAPGATAPTHRR